MPAFIVAVAGPGSVGSLQVLRRVLPSTLEAHRGVMLAPAQAAEVVGQGVVDQALVLAFPDTAGAKSWLKSPDQRAALTQEEASLLANAVIVEKPDAHSEGPLAASKPAIASRGAEFGPAPLLPNDDRAPPPAAADTAAESSTAPLLSPTAIALVALAAMIGSLIYTPVLASNFLGEVRFLLAVFASCFVLALSGYFDADMRSSRWGAAGTVIVVIVFAAIISTLMSTPLVTLMASLVDALRSAAFATPSYPR